MSEYSRGYHQGWRDAEKARAERDKSAGAVLVDPEDLAALLAVYDERNIREPIGEDLARASRVRGLLK